MWINFILFFVIFFLFLVKDFYLSKKNEQRGQLVFTLLIELFIVTPIVYVLIYGPYLYFAQPNGYVQTKNQQLEKLPGSDSYYAKANNNEIIVYQNKKYVVLANQTVIDSSKSAELTTKTIKFSKDKFLGIFLNDKTKQYLFLPKK